MSGIPHEHREDEIIPNCPTNGSPAEMQVR